MARGSASEPRSVVTVNTNQWSEDPSDTRCWRGRVEQQYQQNDCLEAAWKGQIAHPCRAFLIVFSSHVPLCGGIGVLFGGSMVLLNLFVIQAYPKSLPFGEVWEGRGGRKGGGPGSDLL